ncbi:MAG: hypothetical protein LUD38_14295, partial [Parabacteroides sp.]|nr:hypothetical protein [Parabacteroides sp.]
LPSVMQDSPRELQSPRLNMQMWKALTEAKAVQVADVLESMFPGIETTVFEDGDGWYIAIDSGAVELEGTAELERIETILWMLSDFDVVPSENGMQTVECDLSVEEAAEAKAHLEKRAIRAFNAYNAQQRIEDGINAILAHLDHPVTPTTNNAHTAPKRRGIEALIPPAGKKPASKRSA